MLALAARRAGERHYGVLNSYLMQYDYTALFPSPTSGRSSSR